MLEEAAPNVPLEVLTPPPSASPRLGGQRFLKSPLAWAIGFEVCVTAALLLMAWNVYQAHRGSPAAFLPASIPDQVAPSALPSLAVPTSAPAQARPAQAGSAGHGSALVRGQLAGINHDQSAWEQAQWRIVQALTGAARAYLDRVVVPAIQAASARSP